MCRGGAAACARRVGGAQDKAGDDEALGLVGLLGQVGVVGAHGSGGGGGSAAAGAGAQSEQARIRAPTGRLQGANEGVPTGVQTKAVTFESGC